MHTSTKTKPLSPKLTTTCLIATTSTVPLTRCYVKAPFFFKLIHSLACSIQPIETSHIVRTQKHSYLIGPCYRSFWAM